MWIMNGLWVVTPLIPLQDPRSCRVIGGTVLSLFFIHVVAWLDHGGLCGLRTVGGDCTIHSTTIPSLLVIGDSFDTILIHSFVSWLGLLMVDTYGWILNGLQSMGTVVCRPTSDRVRIRCSSFRDS